MMSLHTEGVSTKIKIPQVKTDVVLVLPPQTVIVEESASKVLRTGYSMLFFKNVYLLRWMINSGGNLTMSIFFIDFLLTLQWVHFHSSTTSSLR